jgi:Transposase DDE domain group 1
MTQWTQSSFEFKAHSGRDVVARFDGGTISSDGGSLRLRQTDQRLNLLARFSHCFLDGREQDRVEHSVLEMVAQRVYGLALGYEDVNDHEQLRQDTLFGVLAGREEFDKPLAGKSTLNRLELGTGREDRYKKITFWKQSVDELLVSVFVESQEETPEQIILDIDTTDLPLQGKQEGRFFHGYYDSYCYLPLYIFCGEHVLCARLRPSNNDASAGSLAEIERIVSQIRAAWPEVQIILRGDSGFCRNELMSWCAGHGVDYVFGLARNQRLGSIIGRQMWAATEQWNRTGKPARVCAEFCYQTRKKKNRGWNRERRVVAKAEHLDGKENPRFVVTALSGAQWASQAL